MVAGSLQCPLRRSFASSGHRKGFVVCHTACSYSSFVTAAPVSFAALHSSASHFRSIPPVRSSSICFKAWPALANTQINAHAVTFLFASQRYNTHWVTFRFVRRFFISVLLSPPAAHYFCSPAVPTSAAFAKCCADTIPCTWLIRPSFRHAALSSLASFRRLRALTGNILRRLHMELASVSPGLSWAGLVLYCQPLVGARRHVRSFLPPVPYGGSPPALQCGQVCRTALLLFCRRRFYRL